MPISSDPHAVYYNRYFAYSLRPAREGTPDHDPYAPGMHHFCFRVTDGVAVDRAAEELRTAGMDATEPRYYPEYASDYYATFFEDPDGIRPEINELPGGAAEAHVRLGGEMPTVAPTGPLS